jgi:A/G-specific adenine glycosylase
VSSRLTPEQRAVLRWGRGRRGDLPWRATRDPWAVLVSEVMLQQTQVARVVPRYDSFLGAYPTPSACAQASLADVLARWQGLGYPRRARNLWLAAAACVEQHGGAVPDDLDALLALPGVGRYTARAVLAFAFERPVGVADTNIARVLARRAATSMRPAALQAAADELVPPGRAWEWNQALMDVGALLCRPSAPECGDCPIATTCGWHVAGRPEPDPGVGSAGVSRPQSRYEGSDRQARGRILAALGAGGIDRRDAAEIAGLASDPGRATTVLESLIADGLVAEAGGLLVLGGQRNRSQKPRAAARAS